MREELKRFEAFEKKIKNNLKSEMGKRNLAIRDLAYYFFIL